MAKKNRTETEVEYLRGKNKELEKLNKALRRRVRSLEKYQGNYIPEEDTKDFPLDEEIESVDTTKCKCGNVLGELKVRDKIYKICKTCGVVDKL